MSLTSKQDGRESEIAWTDAGESRQAMTRWLIDASGRSGVLAGQSGQRRPIEAMTTAALWARFENVADMDSPESGLLPMHAQAVSPARRLATNHFCGYGWWSWVIPQENGETSVGLVWDKRLFDPGLKAAGPREAYRRFLGTQPGLRELLAMPR